MGNVARELYSVLNDIYQAQGTNTYDVLSQVLNIPEENRDDIVLAYGMIFGMINQMKSDLTKLQYIRQEKYLEALSNASKALTKISFDGNCTITSYQNCIDKVTLERIDACADLFSQDSGEFEIDEAKLTELLHEVTDLMESVKQSNIDLNLKSVITAGLEDIKKSILNYRFKGVKGIKDALDASAGAMILSTGGAETEEERRIFKSVFELISKFNQLVLFGRNVGAIVSPLVQLWIDNK